jgi:hypothetical protein
VTTPEVVLSQRVNSESAALDSSRGATSRDMPAGSTDHSEVA